MGWYCLERGQGRPLVLLHGIGMSHTAWTPVMDLLARERRVLAFDIAGFGQTPALTGALSTERLLQGLQDSLSERGISGPVDIVGNSMGGWLALAAAHAGLARSMVGISPAGLGDKVLAIPVSIRSHRMPVSAMNRAIDDFAHAPGFEATYDIIDRIPELDRLTLPITIAFGRLDWILTGAMQNRAGLPAQARWLQPWGWGHVPMWDDPEGVARVILDGTR